MKFLGIAFSAIALLASPIAAAPLASGQPYQITNILLYAVNTGNTTLSFTVHDPDPLTNATATCGGSWGTYTQDYPKDSYKTCGNSTFAWHMESYDDYISFVLGLEHVFTDPSVGDYPYDQVITFARGNVTFDYLPCRIEPTEGSASCSQLNGTTIMAPVYAITA